jgi:large conductance mechanosensitive channel
MFNEFKKFAFKGNVLDMAVGVIIGGAFGKIVTSLVNDIIMPTFGFLTAGMDFKELKWVLSPAVMEGNTVLKAESALMYGSFIQNVVDFIIIAFSIFIFIKIINRSREKLIKKQEAVPDTPKGPTAEELLIEIRDLMKNK